VETDSLGGAIGEVAGRYRHELSAEIARELHDGPIQALTTCLVRLEGFRSVTDSEVMQSAISAVEEDARTALTSLRHIIRDLRDEAPVDDFEAAVRAMVARQRSSTGAELAVVVSPDWPALIPGEVALNLLRVVREAVTNAINHAGARHVLLELKSDDEHLVVAISDDGAGFSPEVPQGAGVIGMRERAALLGGRLTVRRRHPGTELRVEVARP
jgi:two-component system sensor histidine kinase UhpB